MKISLSLRILPCLLLSLPVAATAGYRVDLIVTLNRSAPPDVARTHGREARAPDVKAAIDMRDTPGLRRAGIRLLPDKLFGLDNEWRKLRGSRLQPVFRAAWTLEQRPTATAVRFHDDLHYQAHATLDLTTGRAVGPPAFERYRLDGSLLVQQSAGLRVALDLDYTMRVDAAPAEYPSSQATLAVSAAELATLNLRAEKRVNLGQIHFFDHPLLGVLLKVSAAE